MGVLLISLGWKFLVLCFVYHIRICLVFFFWWVFGGMLFSSLFHVAFEAHILFASHT